MGNAILKRVDGTILLMKKTEELPFRIGLLDVIIGMIVTIAITDWFVQPHFDTPGASYSSKMINWLIVTGLFLFIAAAIIGTSVYVRQRISKNKRPTKKR